MRSIVRRMNRLLVIAAISAAAQDKPDNVLFIGNSLTYSRGGIDTMLNSLCSAAGVTMNAQRETVGGMRLSEHAVRAETLARIRQGGWDAVVLQGHSNDATQEHASFVAGAHSLDAEIRAIGAKTLLYMTWAYQDSIGGDMTQRIADAYLALGRDLGAEVVPCGLAWKWMCDNTGLRMYDDYIHPNIYGVYLVGCMFYAALFGTTPYGNTYDTEYGVGAVIADNIQNLAWEYVSGGSVPALVPRPVSARSGDAVRVVAPSAVACNLAGQALPVHRLSSQQRGYRGAWSVTVLPGDTQARACR
jgi:hypothetical protein